MPETTDPTFYRSPAVAIAAPPERLAYVAAFDPAGMQRDALTVVDCDEGSSSYGGVVGWTELPTAGNELHHFGWNACSSALCHEGHVNDGSLERRYLIVPGIRSSRTHVLDTGPNPASRRSCAPSSPRSSPTRRAIRVRTPCIAARAAFSCPI
jgi:methanethiol oxidase